MLFMTTPLASDASPQPSCLQLRKLLHAIGTTSAFKMSHRTQACASTAQVRTSSVVPLHIQTGCELNTVHICQHWLRFLPSAIGKSGDRDGKIGNSSEGVSCMLHRYRSRAMYILNIWSSLIFKVTFATEPQRLSSSLRQHLSDSWR